MRLRMPLFESGVRCELIELSAPIEKRSCSLERIMRTTHLRGYKLRPAV